MSIYEQRMSIQEQIKQLQKQEEELRKQEVEEKKVENQKRLDYMREHKDIILSLMNHDFDNCRYSGYDSYECYDEGNGKIYREIKCPKCLVKHILDNEWVDDWELLFDVIPSFIQ